MNLEARRLESGVNNVPNPAHIEILERGVKDWNKWREENPTIKPDLQKAILKGAHLREADLSGANLRWANLSGAELSEANLSGAVLRNVKLGEVDLRKADLSGTDLIRADLKGADLIWANLEGAILAQATLNRALLIGADLEKAVLREAYLIEANLSRASLREADLTGANLKEANLTWADMRGANLNKALLEGASLIGTNLENATLENCRIYGIACWDLRLEGTKQTNLIITPEHESPVTVDDLKIAQFVYLLLYNENLRDVVNTIGRKAVLILGRFNLPERKEVLEALKEKLRSSGFLPIVFDFERPTERDFTETIMTLAGMCKFIIADITNPRSTPLELQATVPNFMIPFVPIIQREEKPFAMFSDLWNKHDWVLNPLKYSSAEDLTRVLEVAVIQPALELSLELEKRKARKLLSRDTQDYR